MFLSLECVPWGFACKSTDPFAPDILYDKTFSLHRCTPLYNFQFTSGDFKAYGKQLKSFLAANLDDESFGLRDAEANNGGMEKDGKVVSLEFLKVNLEGWHGMHFVGDELMRSTWRLTTSCSDTGQNGMMPIGVKIGFKPKGMNLCLDL